MKQAQFRYYKGWLTAQFHVPKIIDKHGIRSGTLELIPRFYFKNPISIAEDEYYDAVENRYSSGARSFQKSFLNETTPEECIINPHVIQTRDELFEFEPQNEPAFAEVVTEFYAEFEPNPANESYSGWEFIAQKSGYHHGRISGNAFCKVLILEEDHKTRQIEAIQERDNTLSLKKRYGCLSPIASTNRGCASGKLFGFPGLTGCFGKGCTLPGCGLLSLLFLIGALLSLFKNCNNNASDFLPSPQVVHDTVYLKDGQQIKELGDTALLRKTDAIELPNVQFYTNSSKLLPYSIKSIQELADYMNQHPNLKALIKGHTDDVGDAAANLALSQQRAETVRQVMINLGVDATRIEAKGFGETQPKTRDQTIEARAINRRVEVELRNTESIEPIKEKKPEKR
jgi:outer membrane protein OmpA-like peptidoglycan-associated protein